MTHRAVTGLRRCSAGAGVGHTAGDLSWGGDQSWGKTNCAELPSDLHESEARVLPPPPITLSKRSSYKNDGVIKHKLGFKLFLCCVPVQEVWRPHAVFPAGRGGEGIASVTVDGKLSCFPVHGPLQGLVPWWD